MQDFQNLVFGNTVDTASSIISNSEIHIQKNDNTAGFTNTAFYLIKTDYNNLSWKFKITFDTTESIGVRVASSNGNFVYNQFYEQYGIKSGDIVTINSVPESN